MSASYNSNSSFIMYRDTHYIDYFVGIQVYNIIEYSLTQLCYFPNQDNNEGTISYYTCIHYCYQY